MPQYYVRETFFRPDEHSREETHLPAEIVNGLGRLLARHQRDHLFVPIRAMQYQAIVERSEILFVDGQCGYAHQDGVGGRLIQLAWRPQPAAQRTSLDGPVPCEILYYLPDLQPIHRRLVGALRSVIAQGLKRDGLPPAPGGQILPFHRRAHPN